MAQIDQGPATGNASLLFGAGPAASVEVHVPSGVPSLPPAAANAATVDPQAGTFLNNVTGGGSNGNAILQNALNTTVNFASLGTGIKFTIPA